MLAHLKSFSSFTVDKFKSGAASSMFWLSQKKKVIPVCLKYVNYWTVFLIFCYVDGTYIFSNYEGPAALFARPSAATKLSVCTIYLCGPKPTPKTGLTHLYELLFTKNFPIISAHFYAVEQTAFWGIQMAGINKAPRLNNCQKFRICQQIHKLVKTRKLCQIFRI